MNNLRFDKIDNNKYRVILEVPLDNKWYDDVHLNCFNSKDYFDFKLEHKDNNAGIVKFEGVIELPDSALYNTFISCVIDGEKFYLNKDNEFVKEINKVDMKKISVNFNVDDSWKGAPTYHIFVDRFNRSIDSKMIDKPRRNIHWDVNERPQLGPDKDGDWCNDFYGGDIKGITERLGYLYSLGIKVLFLSPIVESQSNHGYDAGDYLKVDIYKGSFDDLRELCDKAHSLGMKVILDGVFNHTGNDSIYYNEYNNYDSDGAYHNKDSYYNKFYKKKYYDDRGYDFKFWWDIFTNLPECDCDSKEWQEFICGPGGVIDKWFECGIDGLRLDVADQLSDKYIELIREACERNKKDSFVYGEVWEQDIYRGRDYVMSGHSMHSIMNYKGMDALIRYYIDNDIDKFINVYNEIVGEYPKETRDTLMNSTSTHDISRIISIFGAPYLFDRNNQWIWNIDNSNHDFIRDFKLSPEEYRRGKEKYLSYLLTLGFLPGNLTIFYGDEVGVQGLGNLDNRRYFPWYNMDEDIYYVARDINRINNSNEFLKTAEPKLLDINDKYIMYERYNKDNRLLVCANKSDDYVDLKLPGEYKEKVYTLNKSNDRLLTPNGGIVMKR